MTKSLTRDGSKLTLLMIFPALVFIAEPGSKHEWSYHVLLSRKDHQAGEEVERDFSTQSEVSRRIPVEVTESSMRPVHSASYHGFRTRFLA
jgi:hypothetical protein